MLRVHYEDAVSTSQREKRSGLFNDMGREEEQVDQILVEDRGAPLTVFSFAGGFHLYAGKPAFEFRGLLCDRKVNTVFIRDPLDMAYHLTPDGKPSGLDALKQQLDTIIGTLGSKDHIAVGSSVGASAALYYATQCRMNRAVLFSPSFPLEEWVAPGSLLRSSLNVKKLLTHRNEYWDTMLLSLISLRSFSYSAPNHG